MTEIEYKEMYREMILETGETASEKEYKEFVAWRKRVEALFAARDESELANCDARLFGSKRIYGLA